MRRNSRLEIRSQKRESNFEFSDPPDICIRPSAFYGDGDADQGPI
jgi:hypothetical protein